MLDFTWPSIVTEAWLTRCITILIIVLLLVLQPTNLSNLFHTTMILTENLLGDRSIGWASSFGSTGFVLYSTALSFAQSPSFLCLIRFSS